MKILIVDDDRVVLSVLGLAIMRAAPDSQLWEAESFESGESEIEGCKPDLVIADYQLGPRSGLALIDRLKAVRPDSAFGLMSGGQMPAHPCVDFFLTKPFGLPEVKLALDLAKQKLAVI